MPNFKVIRPHAYVAGAIIYAVNHTDNENTIYGAHNNSHDEVAGHGHTGAAGDGRILAAVPTLVPIGSVIAWMDYGGLVTFNPLFWQYCDGQAIANVNSPLNGQNTQDLSDRYLVGFGTEGGGDIDSAAWAVGPVGNVNHQINLQHLHTVVAHHHDLSNHIHTVVAHSHTVNGHVHGVGTLKFIVASYADAPTLSWRFYDTAGNNINNAIYADESFELGGGAPRRGDCSDRFGNFAGAAGYGGAGLFTDCYTIGGAGASASTAPGTDAQSPNTGVPSINQSGDTAPITGAPSNNQSGDTAPATDNQLSTVQTIQPRSIRTRWIMRIV